MTAVWVDERGGAPPERWGEGKERKGDKKSNLITVPLLGLQSCTSEDQQEMYTVPIRVHASREPRPCIGCGRAFFLGGFEWNLVLRVLVLVLVLVLVCLMSRRERESERTRARARDSGRDKDSLFVSVTATSAESAFLLKFYR